MLSKKANLSTFLIFEFKMGHKASETTHNINNMFGPGTANERTVPWCFKKFCKADQVRTAVAGHWKLTVTN